MSHILSKGPGNASAEQLHESFPHGTPEFPVGYCVDDLQTPCFYWHWHDDLETGIISKGHAVIAGGDRREDLSEGDMFLIRSAALHAGWSADNGPAESRTLVFDPKLVAGHPGSVFENICVAPFRSPLLPEIITLKGDAAAAAGLHFENAWNACVRPDERDPLTVREELSRMLREFSLRLPGQPQIDPALRRLEEWTKQMLGYIDGHLSEPLKIEAIASAAAISVTEALRCFHAVLDTTPGRYLRDRRVQTAVQLLEQTDFSVSEIGERCGFEGMSYFARVFREAKGRTPSAWRASVRSAVASETGMRKN